MGHDIAQCSAQVSEFNRNLLSAFWESKLLCIHQTRWHHIHKNRNLPWGCPKHATHSELKSFPTWTPPLHRHKRPQSKYLSALYLLLCNLKHRKYKQLSDMLRNIKYTVHRAQQCNGIGDSGFMGCHPVSFGRWCSTLQRKVVPSSSWVWGSLLHGSWSLED
jgi:hypothetical protein